MSRIAFLFLKRIDQLSNPIDSIDSVLCDASFKGWEFFLFADGVFNLDLLTINCLSEDIVLDKKLKWLLYSEEGDWNIDLHSCKLRNIDKKTIKSFNNRFSNVKWLDNIQFKEKIINYKSIVSFI